jgi:hypothetical protein
MQKKEIDVHVILFPIIMHVIDAHVSYKQTKYTHKTEMKILQRTHELLSRLKISSLESCQCVR